MSDVAERAIRPWLGTRRPPPPPSLATALRDRAADRPSGGSLPAALAEAAMESFAALAAETPSRGSKELAAAGPAAGGEMADLRVRAHRLLVADALLTYALEAAAEEGPEAVERLAARLSPPAFARLLPDRS